MKGKGTNMTTEQKPLPSRLGARTTAEEALGGTDLRGKFAIVTGGHAGHNKERVRAIVYGGLRDQILA
jgi:hypothetical protein